MIIGKIFRASMMAGMAISLGCIVNLKVGGLAGAVLFSFGLLTVVHYQLPLFTGRAGFLTLKKLTLLGGILIGNLFGTFISAVLAIVANPDLVTQCEVLTESRMNLNPFSVISLSIGCGFIMTTAVEFARQKQYLPLLFGVPLFIMSGFLHSIADSFYYFVSADCNWKLWSYWLLIVFGNYLGCNAYKLFINN